MYHDRQVVFISLSAVEIFGMWEAGGRSQPQGWFSTSGTLAFGGHGSPEFGRETNFICEQTSHINTLKTAATFETRQMTTAKRVEEGQMGYARLEYLERTDFRCQQERSCKP